MIRRSFKPLVYLLAIAQIIASVPVAGAFASLADAGEKSIHPMSGHAPEGDCAGHMPQSGEAARCPCCPEGGVHADCFAHCLTTAAMSAPLGVMTVAALRVLVRIEIAEPLASTAEPPLKPPPIV